MKKCFLIWLFLIPLLLSGCWENKCSKKLQNLISESVIHCPIDNNYYWNTSFYEKTQIIEVCSKPLFDIINNNKNYNCDEVKLIKKYKQCLDIVNATKYNTSDYYIAQTECVTNIIDSYTEILKQNLK